MSDFKKLRVWQTAHALSLHVHRVTTRIRNPQFASLRSQAFRAAMSIPANIAEGRRQTTDAQTISVRKMLYTLIKRLPTTSVKRAPPTATQNSQ
jgi:hypothetical protein